MRARRPNRLRRAATRAHAEFRDTLTAPQRSALIACVSFALTMVATRAVTGSIRRRRTGAQARRPAVLRDVTVAGVHIHHYVPGVALLAATGALAVRGTDRVGVHCLVGAGYGVGGALVVDEAPLLLNLRDVYWSREGRWATGLVLGIAAAGAAYFTALPLWRGIAAELHEHGDPDHG
ncbi:hypothetical protein Dvina_19655 [Dactylosporangium vinaceum]|uniref:Integral membrane protein n=1 Tax=Dactylosporangium vinaceum TaxID=53362 RepID=A0ABV5M9N6_9ACTN|nr:hypothetical protein [Dactylosporangium vinaceum]UAC00076.1 hypothetical protein Dvina_19655 [Dactylosporangium vinaceum]